MMRLRPPIPERVFGPLLARLLRRPAHAILAPLVFGVAGRFAAAVIERDLRLRAERKTR